MKLVIVILIMFTLSSVFLHSDFIIPQDDPVYFFLESMNNLGYIDQTFSVKPQYYNEIIDILFKLKTDIRSSIFFII